MREGFRVAIPGKDATTASPKEVITDTTLLSLPIHWEGPVIVTAPGGTSVGIGAALSAFGSVTHDLGYAPLTRAWCTAIVNNGTDFVEDPTRKLSVPVIDGGFIFQTYGLKDKVIIRTGPTGAGFGTWASYTIHAYLYIFEFKAEGLTHG